MRSLDAAVESCSADGRLSRAAASAAALQAARQASRGLPFVGAFFLALAILDVARASVSWLTLTRVGVGLGILAAQWSARRGRDRTVAEVQVFEALALALAQTVLDAAVGGRAEPSIYGAVLLLGSSGWLHSANLRMGLSGGYLALWCATAVWALPREEWLVTAGFSALVAVAAVGSLVAHCAAARGRHARNLERLEAEEREQRLREKQRRHDLAARCANDGLWHLDLTTLEFRPSPKWSQMLGLPPGEMSRDPRDWIRRVHPDDAVEFERRFSEHLEGTTERFECKHRVRREDGSYRWVMTRGEAVRDEHGRPVHIAGSLTDIHHVMEMEQKLFHDALHDAVTGLPNRNFFNRELGSACDRGAPTAVLFLDLDRFKQVNDSLGHSAGDDLLKATARRLLDWRGTGEIPARIGGDEFAVLMTDVEDPERPLRAAWEIVELMREPVRVGDARVAVSVSVGVAGPHGEISPDDILRNADIAMYGAKRAGRGRAVVFEPRMLDQVMRTWELQQELGRAVRENRLLVFYQPVIAAATGQIVGAEALLRWPRDDGRAVSPAEFIAVAEECGLILELGDWVLRSVCRRIAAWRAEGRPTMRVAVNVSAAQLKSADFVDRVRAVLRETGASPSWLALELTETAVMEDADGALIALNQLSSLGIHLYLDDFGTGYSSLSYLQKARFDALKIDRSFISEIGARVESDELVAGIVSLAHKLGMKVTAEGVETAAQLSYLVALDCDLAQGYLFGKPAPVEHFERLVEDRSIACPYRFLEESIRAGVEPFRTPADGVEVGAF